MRRHTVRFKIISKNRTNAPILNDDYGDIWENFNDDDISSEYPLQSPPDGQYESFNACIKVLNRYAASRGYAVIKTRTKARKSNKSKLFKAWIDCDRSRQPNYSVTYSDSKRPNRDSKKSDCPFLAICQNLIKGSGVWDFWVFHGGHNHDPSLNPKGHAAIRKLDRKDEFKITVTTHKSAGILARHTYTHFDRTEPDNNLIIRDVYNKRAEIRRRELNDQTPIQALLQSLTTTGEFSTHY